VRLSLIVVADGTPEQVRAALESACSARTAARCAAQCEILVAGASEEAGDPMAEALSGFAGDFRSIQGSLTEPGPLLNGALAAARGAYVLMIEAHERISAGALDRHLEALEGEPELVASYGRTAVQRGGQVRVRPEHGKGGPVFNRLLKEKHLVSSTASLVWRRDALVNGAEPFPGVERRSASRGVPACADYCSPAARRLDLCFKLASRGEFTFHPAVVAERSDETLEIPALKELVKVLLGVLYGHASLEEKPEQRARFRLARHLVAIGKLYYRAEDYRHAKTFFDEALKAAPGYFKGRRYQFLNFVKNTLARES